MSQTPSVYQLVMQEVSRFLHQRGLEPDISMKDGEVEFFMPNNWTQEEFDLLMADLETNLSRLIQKVGGV